MDGITFFEASEYSSNLRCTVQRSGRIGFTDFTQKKLGINENITVKIGIDGTKDSFQHLIFQFLEGKESGGFKINKAGNYYYFNPKALLDELNIVYTGKNIIYDMAPLNSEMKIYKLIKKENKVNNT